MDTIRIERLTLKLSGLDEAEGRLIARRLAERIAEADLSAAIGAERSALEVRVASGAHEPIADLSDRIVEELLRRLVRSE